MEALQLDFSSRKRVFSPKIVEMHSLGVMNIFETAPVPYLFGKRKVLAAQRLLEEDF